MKPCSNKKNNNNIKMFPLRKSCLNSTNPASPRSTILHWSARLLMLSGVKSFAASAGVKPVSHSFRGVRAKHCITEDYVLLSLFFRYKISILSTTNRRRFGLAPKKAVSPKRQPAIRTVINEQQSTTISPTSSMYLVPTNGLSFHIVTTRKTDFLETSAC
ncbi:hypothetical protein KIN20_006490 [Parelaphostrongylus tenuis]|uniref:Uncharacterized protein n=1 Tax=Parelaphostrongylus tenuis TaxID=148309 RepID=A0AAD5QJD4_PARTN|nr:hypothetical protein KIN20_006490 [Parelaphostrongylus tenuis]